jgi:tetratricopeptide (TPR) repeat protein
VAAAAASADTAAAVQAVATATGSGLVLTAVWDAAGGGLELRGSLEDARTGLVVHGFHPIAVSRDAPRAAVDTLRDWTLMAVQDHLHPLLAWGGSDRFPVYEAYLENRRYYEDFDGERLPQAHEHRLRAIELDPDFVRPRLQQGMVWVPGITRPMHDGIVALYQPVHEMSLSPRQRRLVAMVDARMAGSWEEALRLNSEELDRDPTNPCQQMMVVLDAVRANRPSLAVDTARDIHWDPLWPSIGRWLVGHHVAHALHLLGRHEEELALVRELTAGGSIQTMGGSTRADELRALAALGRVDEIDALLTEVFLERDRSSTDAAELLRVVAELRAHGFRDAARELAERTVDLVEAAAPEDRVQLATALIAAGRAEAGCALIEERLAEVVPRGYLLELAGVCAALLGDRATALAIEARIEELGDDTEPTGIPIFRGVPELRRAAIAAQLGDLERAVLLLQQAVAAGYPNYYFLHMRPELEPLWDEPGFQEILRPKG